MTHEQFAITPKNGSPARSVRVTFDVQEIASSGTMVGWEYVKLEGETPGTFAEVYASQLHWGNHRRRTALKVQRDAPLNKELTEVVTAKFDNEWELHRKLLSLDATPGTSIVRMHDLTPPFADQKAEVFPPSILCRKAQHALAPLCPHCGTVLILDPSSIGDERGLMCHNASCARKTGPKTFLKEGTIPLTLLNSTVQRSPACEGCIHQKAQVETCQSHAQWLNFFPSKVLVFERLDLDLSEFLAWTQNPASPVKPSKQAIKKAILELAQQQPLARLKRATEFFLNIVRGVGLLHRLPNGAAHLDLKPENICLALSHSQATAKVIDLGLSVDRNNFEQTRRLQGEQKLQGAFVAPEVGKTLTSAYPYTEGQLTSNQVFTVKLVDSLLTSDFHIDPPFVVGDWVRITTANQVIEGRIHGEVVQNKTGIRLQIKFDQLETKLPVNGMLSVQKVVWQAADIYSLGMLLIALVMNRSDLEHLLGEFKYFAQKLSKNGVKSSLPMREHLQIQLASSSNEVQVFSVLANLFEGVNRLYPDRLAQQLAQELLSIALRCCIRGIPDFSFVTNRADGTADQAAHSPPRIAQLENEIKRVLLLITRREQHSQQESQLKSILKMVQKAIADVKSRVPTRQHTATLPYNTELFWPMLLFPGQYEPERELLLNLYHKNGKLLAAHLERFARELTNQPIEPPPQSPPSPGVQLQPVVRLTRYVHLLRVIRHGDTSVESVLEQLTTRKVPHKLVQDWLQFYQRQHDLTSEVLTTINRLVYVPDCVRAGDIIRLTLTKADHKEFNENWIAEVQDGYKNLLESLQSLAEARLADIDAACKLLDKAEYELRVALAPLERQLQQDRVNEKKVLENWIKRIQDNIANITSFLYAFHQQVYKKWQSLAERRPGFIEWIIGRSETIELKLSEEEYLAREFQKANDSLKAIKDIGVSRIITLELKYLLAEAIHNNQLAARPTPKT